MNKRKLEQSNILFLFIIFISISFISIGYSAYNSVLSISGDAYINVYDYLKITDVNMKNNENGGTELYNPNFTDDSTNVSVVLPNQDSSVTYEIEVTNYTADNYHLDDIRLFSTLSSNLKYEFVDQEALFFPPNSITTIEVKIFYKDTINTNTNVYLFFKYNFIKVDFKNLDYVVSTGIQYIDTGVKNTGNYIFESDFLVTGFTIGDGGWIFCGRVDYYNSLGYFAGRNGFYNGYGAATTVTSKVNLNTWYSLYFSIEEIYLNGNYQSVSGKKLIPEDKAANIYLGGAAVSSTGGVDERYYTGYIKNFIIKDVDIDTIIRYFVPVKLTDTSEIGYWDTINHVFYNNKGTGTFFEP